MAERVVFLLSVDKNKHNAEDRYGSDTAWDYFSQLIREHAEFVHSNSINGLTKWSLITEEK